MLTTSSFCLSLSAWLAKQLCLYLGRFWQSHIKNSQAYDRKLLYYVFHNSTKVVKIASLSIVTLFYQVPVDDGLAFMKWKLLRREITVPIPVSMFISLLKLCIQGNVFKFEGSLFRQKFSLAMGS